MLLSVASVVPIVLNSSHFDIHIYDDRDVLIPFQGLMNIITSRIHFEKFHLRIEVGREVSDEYMVRIH